MTVRNWHDWFVPEDTPVQPAHVTADQLSIVSGSQHKDYDALDFKRDKAPRCAKCKKDMGYDDGMYIIISDEWRVHIHCFSEVLERHFENGEVIDLTTGNIVNIEGVD